MALFDAWYVRVDTAMHYLNSIHNYCLATLASGSVEFVLEIFVSGSVEQYLLLASPGFV